MLALSVVGGPHHVFPVPGGPVLGLAFFQSLRVAAESGCDFQQTTCTWVREQLSTADMLLEWRSIEELAWLVPGASTALGLFFTTIASVREALKVAEPQACDGTNDDDDGGSMADTGPILEWSGVMVPRAPPLPGADEPATGPTLAFAYQRAYLDAARRTWSVNGDSEDLRPWIIAQTSWDIEYLQGKYPAALGTMTTEARRIVSALRMLAAWRTSAGALNEPGPWSRATVERLLFQRGTLSGLLPGGGDTDNGGGGGGGGSGALWVAGGLAVLAALAGGR